MATKAEKLKQLSDLRSSLPYISQSALGALLSAAKDSPLPEFCTRKRIREARNSIACQDTPYGPLMKRVTVPGINGRPICFDVQCPFAMLWLVAKTQNGAALFRSAAPPSHSNPWKLIFYSDEVTPGNSMKQDNKRMLQGCYYSIIDFGAAALSKEDNWFVCTALKSTTVRLIEGGMSSVMAALLKHFFHWGCT